MFSFWKKTGSDNLGDIPIEARQAFEAGVEAMNRGDFARAAQLFEAAAAEAPGSAEAHCGLGVALIQVRRYEDARKALQRAVEIRKDFPEASFALGYVFNI